MSEPPPAYLEWVGCGSGVGAGWEWGRAHPFEIYKPPPPGCEIGKEKFAPRLSRKSALRAGSSINAPLRDNRGLVSKGCVE